MQRPRRIGESTTCVRAASALVSCTLLACSRGNAVAETHEAPRREITQESLAAAAPPSPLASKDGGDALAQVAERTLSSVVSVASTRVPRLEIPGGLDLPGATPEQHGLGSGVIVGPNVILTNAHVVEGADRLEIILKDKRTLTAQVVGADPKTDLAVLRVQGDTSGLRPLEFADSSRVRLGEIVLAVGNPFGIGQTVTMGIVSGLGRANLGIVDYEDFIQTDAAINPGNSGGALIDTNGRLIGIPTAILSRSGANMGLGFAIPSNMAKPIMNSLLQSGRVTRGYMGLAVQEVDQEIANALGLPNTDGVLISDLSPSGPAASAGLQRGDVVLSIDAKPIRSTGEVRNLIAAAAPGKTVSVEVLRGNDKRRIDVRIAELPGTSPGPKAAPEPSQGPAAGLMLAPLDATMRKRLSVPATVQKGVLVTGVARRSPAARAGIRPGDVIVELGKKPVDSPARFAELWKSVRLPTAVMIVRDGRTAYLPLSR